MADKVRTPIMSALETLEALFKPTISIDSRCLISRSSQSHQAGIAISKVRTAIPNFTVEIDENDSHLQIKLSRHILQDLCYSSQHKILVRACQAFAEAAGVDKPKDVSVKKDHTRLSFMFGPKIYMVLPDRASAEKVMAHAHPHNFLHPA